MRFEKIWVQQSRTTKGIKRHFGAKSALDYLIREKLIAFADDAERHPEFAKELPDSWLRSGRCLTSTSLPDTSRRRNRRKESNCADYCL